MAKDDVAVEEVHVEPAGAEVAMKLVPAGDLASARLLVQQIEGWQNAEAYDDQSAEGGTITPVLKPSVKGKGRRDRYDGCADAEKHLIVGLGTEKHQDATDDDSKARL